MKLLSIVIPAYNEASTVGELLSRVYKVKFPFKIEIIVVDDGSNDGTGEIVSKWLKNKERVKLITHEKNMGKGQAILTGAALAKGDYIVIQDADLEYDPNDIIRLAEKVYGDSSVIYGSRLAAPPILYGENKTPMLSHFIGNKMLSLITSIVYGQWITDMETCYKLFPRKFLYEAKLRSKGFEFEPEITAKLIKQGYKISEININTKPRSFLEGKKINTFKDGFRALWTLIKYRFID